MKDDDYATFVIPGRRGELRGPKELIEKLEFIEFNRSMRHEHDVDAGGNCRELGCNYYADAKLVGDAAHAEYRAVDEVNHPPHYTRHPSGVECVTITEHFNFNVGNAIKYLWRIGLKSADAITDLRKAEWYVRREIERLTGGDQE